ncbi:hypothetical protein [Kangiella sp. TOML190]|nr:hypothetical protein [Kangiella sp. TOML190]
MGEKVGIKTDTARGDKAFRPEAPDIRRKLHPCISGTSANP